MERRKSNLGNVPMSVLGYEEGRACRIIRITVIFASHSEKLSCSLPGQDNHLVVSVAGRLLSTLPCRLSLSFVAYLLRCRHLIDSHRPFFAFIFLNKPEPTSTAPCRLSATRRRLLVLRRVMPRQPRRTSQIAQSRRASDGTVPKATSGTLSGTESCRS